MAFYLISITIRDQLRGKKVIAGIREVMDKDIDRVFQKLEYQYRQYYGESRVLSFNCYGLAKRSSEVRQYLANKNVDDFTLDIPDVTSLDDKPKTWRNRKEWLKERGPAASKKG